MRADMVIEGSVVEFVDTGAQNIDGSWRVNLNIPTYPGSSRRRIELENMDDPTRTDTLTCDDNFPLCVSSYPDR